MHFKELGSLMLPAVSMKIRRALPLMLVPALASAASINVEVRDSGGAPVADAVVYALPAANQQAGQKPKGAAIDQVHKQFVPYVTVVQTGAAVTFPNRDNIRHEVYSFSPAKVFKLKLYAGTPAQPIVFDKPGTVVLGCNIHDRMLAFVYVVDTPFFVRTTGDGVAHLDNLPAGVYQLRLAHPQLGAEPPPRALTLTADAVSQQPYALTLGPSPAPMSMPDM